jgi:glycosyltransferase involved in cell wall biosynthesis
LNASPLPFAAMAAPHISVVIPVYDEVEFVGQVIDRVLALGLDCEIICVDDGSSDGTPDVLAAKSESDERVIVHLRQVNGGKGAALRDGIALTSGRFVVIQDADLEYDPSDLPRLLEPLNQGVADVVYGTRLRGGEPQRAHLFWHYVGNRFLSLLTNVLYNTTISDMEVGYKAFDGALIRSLKIQSNDFRFEPEITAKVLRIAGVRLYEVPISYYGRTFAEGKKITWRDGFKALGALLRFRVSPPPQTSWRAPRS